MEYTIRKLPVKENLSVADELVGELHLSQKEMNPNTADWPLIRKNYLRFMAECEQENNGTFMIAETEGQAIGFIFGYMEEKDDSNFELGDQDDLYVSDGYVKPEYRKQGIYSALNAAFEEAYKEYSIRRIYRFTSCSNHTMQSWLSKQGYSPVRLLYEKWL
ncbi:GNAT family N-acetyltransferase [Chryseobacterium camelliae]|uniref:GNAT family N-acetyltransferase n=1 Tax=Chryseobacterium camelliae TaxID=1265445 RepID=UPI0028567184|nr:GNAT family N-acetyltransferase [Chryseobacterium camelliae]MDR6516423.1 ribosomal protein S18 acetylase RimI-like enzyme [Chryseobacterium camelliae]